MNTLKRTMLTLPALISLFVVSGCTNPDDSIRLLKNQGMTNIEITGYNLLACSDDDVYHTGFEATTPNGTQVSGTVCSGLFFKGSTIRFD